jgi:hypothetical protein
MQPARVCKLAYHQSTLPLAQMKVLPPSQMCSTGLTSHMVLVTPAAYISLRYSVRLQLHARGASTIRAGEYTLYTMLMYNYLDAAL